MASRPKNDAGSAKQPAGGAAQNQQAQEPLRAVIPQEVDTSGVTIAPGPDQQLDSLGALTPDALPQPEFVAPLESALDEPMKEQGGTGLKGSEPYGGWVYEEYLPQLRGMQGAKVYREMADNDPMCGAVLFALEMLMRAVKWRVEPADQRPESVAYAERLEAGLFNDMASPWGQVIDEASSMLTYGYAPHEIVWKVCKGETDNPNTSSQFEDGLIMPAALPIRSQDTIWRWIFDEEGRGNVLGLEQYRPTLRNAIIPIQKLLLFRTVKRKNNPEGRSILRNAYRQYLRKETIEQAEGRLANRSAGVVRLRIPAKYMQAGAGSDEAKIYAAFKTMADKLAQDRSGSVILPSDRWPAGQDGAGELMYELDYVVADARKVGDMSPIIDRMDSRMAMSVLADFLMLGQKNVGSWALADSKTSMFVTATGGFLGNIEEEVARVLVNKIWRLNALDPTTKPKVKAGSVQKTDLDALGNYLKNLSAGGAPLFPSVDGRLEQHLLSVAELPTPREEG
jgi:hypothetical protein